MLILQGDWRGLYLMWHPPGYPLVLSGICKFAALFGIALTPYAAGTALSIWSGLLLVLLADCLVSAHYPSAIPRILTAGFIALYEGLAYFSSGPLSEPLYLVLIYSVVVMADRMQPSLLRTMIAALLLGFACTVRREGAIVAMVLGLAVAIPYAWSAGRFSLGRLASSFSVLVLSGLAASLWMLADPGYRELLTSDSSGFTVPRVSGFLANVQRACEVAYVACIDWLPHVVLLPFVPLATLGLVEMQGDNALKRRRLNVFLLAVVVPTVVTCALTLMHKRTGSVILPAVGIWVGLGVATLVNRLHSRGKMWEAVAIAVGAALLVVGQAARPALKMARSAPSPPGVPQAAAELLTKHASRDNAVWSFGCEPEVYVEWGTAFYFPFREFRQQYLPVYERHRGDPGAFVAAVKEQGCGYLTFTIAEQSQQQEGDPEALEPQPYWFGEFPLRSDLCALADDPEQYGLRLLGEIQAAPGRRVLLFSLARSRDAEQP